MVPSLQDAARDFSSVGSRSTQARLQLLSSSLAATHRIDQVLLPSLKTLERVHEGCEAPAEEIVSLEALQTKADKAHSVVVGPLQGKIAAEEKVLTGFLQERQKLIAALREMDRRGPLTADTGSWCAALDMLLQCDAPPIHRGHADTCAAMQSMSVTRALKSKFF